MVSPKDEDYPKVVSEARANLETSFAPPGPYSPEEARSGKPKAIPKVETYRKKHLSVL